MRKVQASETQMSWSPGMVPYGADQTVYLVVDSVGVAGRFYRETESERVDLEAVISDFITGQFNAPVRIFAFNTLEHWIDDVSQQVAEDIQMRCDIDGEPVPEHIRDFLQRHRKLGPTPQAACLQASDR